MKHALFGALTLSALTAATARFAQKTSVAEVPMSPRADVTQGSVTMGPTEVAGLQEGEGAACALPAEAPDASAGASAGADAGVFIEPPLPDDPPPTTLEDQRRQLFHRMQRESDLTADQLAAIEKIVEASPLIGQGNPEISHHAMTPAQCRAVRAAEGLKVVPHPPCDRRNMVPLYNPDTGETAADARVCIDQFEFPDIPCEYPVVYPTSREAALLCAAAGKRICDAHEWEGACAGALHPPEEEYAFGQPRPYATWLHNQHRQIRWAYGAEKDHILCATLAVKSPKCAGGGYHQCGTHTWPAGSFPACVSSFGVYDQHGNAAEHMNLPLEESELGSRGGTGATEMKGSWFIFAREEPHEDDCRWRAKDWHPSELMDEDSHRNYHLGFRCCKDLGGAQGGNLKDGGANDGGPNDGGANDGGPSPRPRRKRPKPPDVFENTP